VRVFVLVTIDGNQDGPPISHTIDRKLVVGDNVSIESATAAAEAAAKAAYLYRLSAR
jgi:hypothetical protein